MATHNAVILRECGVSSTLRPIVSITNISGILDHPPSRVTTTECAFAFSRLKKSEACITFSLKTEGAGNAGCLLHPRSRVQCARGSAHTSIQVQPEHSGIPCAMGLRLMPRSPRRRIRFVTVASRIEDLSKPGWADASPQGVASATDARTTRFCRTQHPPSSRGFAGLKYKSVEALAKAEASFVCALLFTHGKAALRTRFTPTLLRPPHPTPRP